MPDLAAPAGYETSPSGLFLPTQLRADAQSDLSNPSAWLVDFAQGGWRSHAGVQVSPRTSMALAAYYACLNVIAQDCAKLPLPVLRSLDRGSEKVREHWLWRILQQVYNPDMTAYIGRYVMTAHAVGWGNGYGLILRDRSMTRLEGQPTGIYPIHPARVRPARDRSTGELVYHISDGMPLQRDTQTVPQAVPASDMIHLKGPTGDGLVGYSVAQIAAENLGLALAAQQFGASFFGKGGAPSGILKTPQTLKDDNAARRLKQSFLDAAQGAGIPLLEQGLEWTAYSIPPDQAQFIATRMQGDLDICRWFRMSPHKIGILDNAHYNNIEQANIEHWTDTMLPWLVMWESELWMKLLDNEPDLFARHDTRAVMRGDSQARAEYYRTMVQIAAYNANEVREFEDMSPYEGGNEFFMQIQYAPVRKIIDGTARQPRQVQRPLSPGDTTTGASHNGHVNGHHALVDD